MKAALVMLSSLVIWAYAALLAGCGKGAPPNPVGIWTVRHEIKPDGGELLGFATSSVTIQEDGTFSERLETDLFEGSDPEPVNYRGIWRQDADVVRFKRDDGESTDSYTIDKQGLRMKGNVAGLSVVLTRRLDQ